MTKRKEPYDISKMKMSSFHVFCDRQNDNRFFDKKYDVIPYLVQQYMNKYAVRDKKKRMAILPKTYEEFRSFLLSEIHYQWWSRCQYEILVSPNLHKDNTVSIKTDIAAQLIPNIDLVCTLVWQAVRKTVYAPLFAEGEVPVITQYKLMEISEGSLVWTDVMPYLLERYKTIQPALSTDKEIHDFLLDALTDTTRWTVVLHDWPSERKSEIVFGFTQLMQNWSYVTDIFKSLVYGG